MKKMKKIELNAPLRFILVILIWLLTFTVVNVEGATLNNFGAGLIGTLVFYVGALFLAFVYFNDCQLKKACKLSLVVVVILTVCNLATDCYGYILDAFEVQAEGAYKVKSVFDNIYLIGRNVVMGVFLILALVQSLMAENCSCECKKDAPKGETEAKAEEIKEEPKAEEVKEEPKADAIPEVEAEEEKDLKAE